MTKVLRPQIGLKVLQKSAVEIMMLPISVVLSPTPPVKEIGLKPT